ncbi:hypothetical protein FJZ48_01625 [Candidatus Uhrbacteria bacterium]|nr:hypothetical protein [Candidatus Uhrbacteria bacterium]
MPNDHVIGSGLTEDQLKLASFWLRHGINLQNIGYGALILFSVLTWGYTLWMVLDTYVISYPREHRMITHIAQTALDPTALQATAPQPVQLSEVNVFSTTDNRQDFLVELTNPNTHWWVSFSYHFENNGEQTPQRSSFVLPQAQRPLTELGWKSKSGSRSAQLVIDSMQWHRVNPNMVEGDYAAFAAKRNQLYVSDVKYQNNLTIGTQTIGQTTLTLVNPSGYGFWAVDLTAIVSRAGNPVAVTTVTQREIKPGEIRPVIIDWFENLPGISNTDIQLNVNILDPKSYLSSERF